MIVLDTHAWIWWRTDPGKLSTAAAQGIGDADALGLCTISVWELGTLVRRGRLTLDRDIRRWVRQALANPRVTVLAPEAEVALAAALLDDSFPGDPADRLIYATAHRAGARLVTRDDGVRRFDPARVLW